MAKLSLIRNYVSYSIDVEHDDYLALTSAQRSGIKEQVRRLSPDRIDLVEWECIVPEYGETHAHLYFRIAADADSEEIRSGILEVVSAGIDERQAAPVRR